MLHIAIAINDKILYHVSIQRKYPIDRGIASNEMCVYHLTGAENNFIKEFTHRYGDGALACAVKALQILIENEKINVLPTEQRGT